MVGVKGWKSRIEIECIGRMTVKVEDPQKRRCRSASTGNRQGGAANEAHRSDAEAGRGISDEAHCLTPCLGSAVRALLSRMEIRVQI